MTNVLLWNNLCIDITVIRCIIVAICTLHKLQFSCLFLTKKTKKLNLSCKIGLFCLEIPYYVSYLSNFNHRYTSGAMISACSYMRKMSWLIVHCSTYMGTFHVFLRFIMPIFYFLKWILIISYIFFIILIQDTERWP